MTWRWKQVDVHGLRTAIKEVTWTDILDAKSANEAWTMLRTRLEEMAKQYIPCKYVAQHTTPKPWMTQDIKLAIKLRHQPFRNYH